MGSLNIPSIMVVPPDKQLIKLSGFQVQGYKRRAVVGKQLGKIRARVADLVFPIGNTQLIVAQNDIESARVFVQGIIEKLKGEDRFQRYGGSRHLITGTAEVVPKDEKISFQDVAEGGNEVKVGGFYNMQPGQKVPHNLIQIRNPQDFETTPETFQYTGIFADQTMAVLLPTAMIPDPYNPTGNPHIQALLDRKGIYTPERIREIHNDETAQRQAARWRGREQSCRSPSARR